MCKDKHNTLLWEIKGDNIKSPSYIFGTMHVQDERAFNKIAFIEDCILKSEAFAAEFDLDIQNPKAFESIAMFPKGEKLSDYLTPKIYEKLAKLFYKETGMKLSQFEHHKPVMIINLLSSAQFKEDNFVSLDQHLYNFAKNGDKTMLGIESFESQLEVMRKMSLREQIKSLKDMATHFERFRRSIKKTAALYLEADLMKILKKVKQTAGGMRSMLLYDRNIIMAERIIKLSADQSLFTAIGAGHLAGKKGVLRLLKKAGLKVVPINY